MENILEAEPTAENKAELIKQFDEYLAKAQHIHEEIVRDQKEIDRTTAETWALLAQLREVA